MMADRDESVLASARCPQEPSIVDAEVALGRLIAGEGREACRDGCRYSKDVGMWPEHSCANGCAYEREPVPKPAHRLLTNGDVIQSGDEVLSDDTLTWLPLVGWEIGLPYRRELYVPTRRATPQDCLPELADAPQKESPNHV